MKLKKIFLLLLVAITVVSLFTINSFAADEVDYNNSFAINIDGEYTYYSYSFLSNPTWEDYIRARTELYGDCEFSTLGDYVIHDNHILTWKGHYVYKYENIRAAAGSGIYYYDDTYLIVCDDDTISFHPAFEVFNITFADLFKLSNVFPEFSVYGKYSNYITYDGKIIKKTDYNGELVYVKSTDNVKSITYYYENIDCNHDLILKTSIPGTCTQLGYNEYQCRLCKTYKEYEYIGLNLELHDYGVVLLKEPTCELFGYSVVKCIFCGKSVTTHLNPVGHKYTEPTECGTKGYCINCGEESHNAALPHDVTDTCYCNRCGLQVKEHNYDDTATCIVCGYVLPVPEVDSNLGETIWNGVIGAGEWVWNGVTWSWNWITSGVSKGASAVGEAAEETYEAVKDFFLGDDGILTGATEVLKIVFLVMALALLVIVVIKIVILFKTKIVPQLKTRKTRKRRKRRK